MEFHLSIAGERSGPHTQFWIIDGIRDGRFTGAELAWHKGLGDWIPLKQISAFDGYWPTAPAVIDQAEAARQLARAELDRPQPWLRFWARVIDYIWFVMTLGMMASFFLPASALDALRQSPLMVPVDVFVFLLYLPVEAWLLSKFGTTPGKALLRIQVRRLDGALPSYQQALQRSFQVYLKGIAIGLPIAYLFAMAWWRIKLLQNGVTAWDEANETRVEHGEPEVWRYLLLAGILLSVALIIFAMVALSPEIQEAMSRLPK